MSWLISNLVNIVLILVIAVVCVLVIRGMIRDRRAGRCSCGGECSGCSGACPGCSAARKK